MPEQQLSAYPSLAELVRTQLEVWPQHRPLLERRLQDCSAAELAFCNLLAEMIAALAKDDLATLCRSYQWACSQLFREEVYFRRTGSYRYRTSAEVAARFYHDVTLMERYLHCALISQVFWANHTASAYAFASAFLPANPAGYAHLEIGPGPGLLLSFAARDPRCRRIEAWDISQSSLDYTARCLQQLGIDRRVELARRDALDAAAVDEPAFDSIAISEVLEHVEAPELVLQTAFRLLVPGGRLFVNMPVNSPVPDHVYLLRQPEEVVALVADAGFDVEESRFFPATGYTEKRARATGTTISCVVFGRRGPDSGARSAQSVNRGSLVSGGTGR